MSSAICFNLDQSKILSSGNGLNTIIVEDKITCRSICHLQMHRNWTSGRLCHIVNCQGHFMTCIGITVYICIYFMLSGRISRNIGENIFQSYTGTTSENTNFHVLVAEVNCTCLTTRCKYNVIYLTFLALDVIL